MSFQRLKYSHKRNSFNKAGPFLTKHVRTTCEVRVKLVEHDKQILEITIRRGEMMDSF